MRKEILNNCVRTIRQEHHMTQEELASSVDVTRQTIIAIEKGNYTPSVMLAFKIAHIFEVSCEELFFIKK